MRKPKIKTTLEKISRLYAITEEMRAIITDLHEVQVEVKIGSFYSGHDPLGQSASIMVMMRPGCELMPK